MNTFNVYCQGKDNKNIYIGDYVLYYATANSRSPRLAVVEGIQATAKSAMVKFVGQKSWHNSMTMKAVRIGLLEKEIIKAFSEHNVTLTLEDTMHIAESVRNAVHLESLEDEIALLGDDSVPDDDVDDEAQE